MAQVLTNVIGMLRSGGVGILPTDTLYGLVGRALDESAVERIYKLKNRRSDKPFIILISDRKDLTLFGIVLDEKTEKFLNSVWPGPVSVILPAPLAPAHLLRGGLPAAPRAGEVGKTLAFRLPNNADLLKLIKAVGPIVAPSANPEGLPPAKNIAEAKNYFGGKVDFYLNGGEFAGEPSTIVSFVDGNPKILRGGLG